MTNLGPNFYPKLVQIAAELQMPPEDILAVMVSESGIKPESEEKERHGTGLIGFMPQTLENLGYKDGYQKFKTESGETQLDYVKKYIADKIKLNGGPLKSAAQYYVANFFPAALRLPGIKAQDPSTQFVEEYPETIKGKDGISYSKKYYDIGFRVPASTESMAYKKNTLFHGSTRGAITYGDMMRQIEKNKQSPVYRNAIKAMKSATNYTPSSNSNSNSNSSTSHDDESSFLAKLQKILRMFAHKKNNFLVVCGSSSDKDVTAEYAYVLASAIEHYLGAKTAVHCDPSNIEIECAVPITASKQKQFDAIKELSASIAEAFKSQTDYSAFAHVMADVKSDFAPMTPRQADLCNRKFLVKMASQS